jgi:hypothetical protein
MEPFSKTEVLKKPHLNEFHRAVLFGQPFFMETEISGQF